MTAHEAKITLFRHGRVAFNEWQWSDRSRFRHLVTQYDTAPLRPTAPPNIAHRYDTVISSTRARSIATAGLLLRTPDCCDPIFNEAELPDLFTQGRARPFCKLPNVVWFVGARVLWRLGHSSNCESHRAFSARAERAAQRLIILATPGRSVALIGHAVMNQYIADHLNRAGFEGPRSPKREHWKGTLYRRPVSAPPRPKPA